MSGLPGSTTYAQSVRNLAIAWKCYCLSAIDEKCLVCRTNEARLSDLSPIAAGCTCYWEMGQIWGDDPNCPMHFPADGGVSVLSA